MVYNKVFLYFPDAFTRDKLIYAWRPEGASVNIAHRLQHFDFDFSFNGDKENVNFPSGE
jgi:hypothetical protein